MRQNKFIVVLCLMLLNLVCLRLPIKAQSVNSSNLPKSDITPKKTTPILPSAPNSGTPVSNGKQAPAATRNPDNCSKTSLCLTGLFQNDGKDFTVSSYPTFWFYISSEIQNSKEIKFRLRNLQKDTTIYETSVSSKSDSNIVKISLPKEAKYALENNAFYRWDLMVFSNKNDGSKQKEADLELYGFINKLPMETEGENILKNLPRDEVYKVYLENEIWYDAINELSELYFSNPNDQKIKTEWVKLLNSLNLEELSKENLVY